MYTDIYLKFADEAECNAALFDEETVTQDDVVEIVKRPKYLAVDVIGTIYKPTGNMLTTDEGDVPEMAPLDGWHANVRETEEKPELDAWRVTPAAPVRMWF